MIKFSSWNIRGLNNPIKQVERRSFILANKLSLMGIVESKIRQENLAVSRKKSLLARWDYVHNTGTGSVARIIVAWNTQGPKVSVIASSDQMILLSVMISTTTLG